MNDRTTMDERQDDDRRTTGRTMDELTTKTGETTTTRTSEMTTIRTSGTRTKSTSETTTTRTRRTGEMTRRKSEKSRGRTGTAGFDDEEADSTRRRWVRQGRQVLQREDRLNGAARTQRRRLRPNDGGYDPTKEATTQRRRIGPDEGGYDPTTEATTQQRR